MTGPALVLAGIGAVDVTAVALAALVRLARRCHTRRPPARTDRELAALIRTSHKGNRP